MLFSWLACIVRNGARTTAAVIAAVLFNSLPARAADYGTCPAADLVETDLKQSSSSGYYIPGLHMIVLNRLILQRYAEPVGKFILAHECAHTDPAIDADEDAADCAAAQRGTQEGWLGKSEIIQVCVHLSHLIPDDRHPPAVYRCANIRRCAAAAADAPGGYHEANSQVPSDVTPLTPKRYALSGPMTR